MYLICERCKREPDPESTYAPIKGLPVLTSLVEASTTSVLEAIDATLTRLRSPKYKGEICGRCERPFADDDVRWGYREYKWQTYLEAPHFRLPVPQTDEEKFEQWGTLGEQKKRS